MDYKIGVCVAFAPAARKDSRRRAILLRGSAELDEALTVLSDIDIVMIVIMVLAE